MIGIRLGLSVMVCGLLLAGASSPRADDDKPTAVGVDTVREVPLAQTVPVLGRLVAEQSVVVAARIAGPVFEVPVRVGQRVNASDILTVIEKDALEWSHRLRIAENTQAEAAISTARAQVSLLDQELQRLEKLRKSAAFSQARHDDKRNEVVRARSTLAEAEAARGASLAKLRLAEIDLANADIRAPFGGVVTARHVSAGAYLKVGDPVVTLIDDQHLEVAADVPAIRVGGLAPGTRVPTRISDRLVVTATVRAVVPEEDPRTRTRTVRLTPDLDPFPAKLAINQSVTLDVPVGAPRQVLSVHKDAVLRRKGDTVVFVIEEGLAKIRPVSLGQAVGVRFEVLEGLAPGTVVVSRGNERLRPDQPVMPNDSASPSAPESAK